MSETRAQYGGRLREVADRMQRNKPLGVYAPHTLQLAADEITRLRAENERLRVALELIVGDHEFCGDDWGDRREAWIETARAALNHAAPAAEQEGE